MISADNAEPATDALVASSQQEWLRLRRAMHTHHTALAKTAAQLYPEHDRVVDTGLITRPGWLFPQPIEISDILMSLIAATPPSPIMGTEDSNTLPLLDAGSRYSNYSAAMRDLAKPRLFENRPGWRLIDIDFATDNKPSLVFGETTYFEVLDICEALAHETAMAHLDSAGRIASPSWAKLSFRRLLGDPFDLSRRAVMPSTDTLTIRAGATDASFVLHYRDPSSVAGSGGMLGVVPAGAFQPSTDQMSKSKADFDLWRNIMREYSEELLGNPEYHEEIKHLDYTIEPFISLEEGLRQGKIRTFFFGVAFDALTLWAEFLTAVVFDADIYDRLFPGMITDNAEGPIFLIGSDSPTKQIPFQREVIDRLTAAYKLTPEAAGCLHLAWKYRQSILTPI